MNPTTIDVSGAIRKTEVETRTSKGGGQYDVLVITLATGDRIDVTSFNPVDKGYLVLLKTLARPKGGAS